METNDLFEFSTSMDFEEFDIVLKHLRILDQNLARIFSAVINEFKSSTPIGEADTWKFEGAPGYMVLEREDDYAFSIAVFAIKEVHALIDAAYERGSEELGI